MKYLTCLLAALWMLAAIPAEAAPARYIYDPAQTRVLFKVTQLGFSHPHGGFAKFGGSFTFDPDAPEKSTVMMNIDTRSLFMNSAGWENTLKGRSFFNVDQYPSMTFKSISIHKIDAHHGKLTGNLTLLGVTKPVTLTVAYNSANTQQSGKNPTTGFSASGTIHRADFGMTFGTPGIGNNVVLDIQVAGIRQDFDTLQQ